MPSEVFRLKLHRSLGGECWLFKDDRGWFITGNPKNAKIPSFATEEAAWEAVNEVRRHWPFADQSSDSLFVVRVAVEEPVYDGPRHTSWTRISGESDAF